MAVKSVIYQFFNTVNHKRYIGSTCNYRKRKNLHLHLLEKGMHHCKHLQHAWNKYGGDTFIITILEECPVNQLLIREQFWLDFVKPEYNSRLIAEANRGGKHKPESIELMRNKRKEKWASLTEIDRKKIMAKISKSKSKPVSQYTKTEEFIQHYESSAHAARSLNSNDNSHINSCCNGKRKSAFGFIWKFKQEEATWQ